MNWGKLHVFLKEIFAPINEGQPLLSPQEFWNQYGDQIKMFDEETLESQFTDFGNGIWLPKVYESARILFNVRQRRKKSNIPNDGRELVEGMRIEIEPRYRPMRNISRSILSGGSKIMAAIGDKQSYSKFQVDGWQIADSIITQQKNLVIVAPTGAGKTEVFLLPLIAQIANVLNQKNGKVPHYIFVYPRVALLKDQLSRILLYAHRASSNFQLPNPIVVGLQYSGIGSDRDQTFKNKAIFNQNQFLTIEECPKENCNGQLHKENARKNSQGVIILRCNKCKTGYPVTLSRKDHETGQPNILVTTLESLDNLYLNPKVEGFMRNIDGLVFDEIHLYNSLYGAHAANIIKRIENFQQHGKPLVKIAASATVSSPERFVAKLFSGNPNANITLLDADIYLDKEEAGLEALFFLRSPDGEESPPPQATLLQIGMAMGHSILYSGDRSILFTESVDHANRTGLQLDNAEKGQNLWAFRSLVDEIYYDGQPCPKTNAFECEIYSSGECWRGVHGGANCVLQDNLIRPLDINVITSKNTNLISMGDLVVATASLEVGVDDPNFKATIHYRPPLNVFSFIQRRGRAGRSGQEVAYTVMVLGNDANDEFYFRRRNRLINGRNYELPLNPLNPIIAQMHKALEIERHSIESLTSLSGYPHDSKSILMWILAKYRNCTTLYRLFSSDLDGMYKNVQLANSWKSLQQQQDNFRKWIGEKQKIFKKHLDIEIMLQELEFKIPNEQQGLVRLLRSQIHTYKEGNIESEDLIYQTAIQILGDLDKLLISPKVNSREQKNLDWLRDLVVDISRNYAWSERLEIEPKQITALYQFFTLWYEKMDHTKYGHVVLNYVPQAIKLTLQSLYYTGTICLDNLSVCPSCTNFYIPDSYFQEVKPILVQTLTPDELDHGSAETQIEVEDSTKLASMLTLYKPFYRYSVQDDMMSVLVTEHDPAWVKENDAGNIVVGVQLRADGLHQDDGSLTPRRIFVRSIKADEEGKNVLKLCTRCYRLHDEDTRQACNCGWNLTNVNLYPSPIVERKADIYQSYQLTDTFSFCEQLTGHTIIHGSSVSYKQMVWTGQEYVTKNQDAQEFIALYRNPQGGMQPLKYSINTKGFVWNLDDIVKSLLADTSLSEILKEYKKDLSSQLVLHTASHMLHKAASSLSGVAEHVLEYAIFPEKNYVIIWERYEGGVGLSEILRDIIREDPEKFYKELLYSIECPVHLSAFNWRSKEALRNELAQKWILDLNDEFVENVVNETFAEKQATKAKQAEHEAGCTDGCPACVHISTCTERGNQISLVSRHVAEQIVERLIKRDIDHLQLEGIQSIRAKQNMYDLPILGYDEQRETYHVLCL